MVFSEFQGIFSIVRHLRREPDVWARNRIFTNFFKSLKTCLAGVFWVFFSQESDFQKFLKMPQSVFSWCFLSVSKYFKHCSTSGPRTGFLSRELDFQKFLEKPQNMFCSCFLSVLRYFSIVRNLCWEPHFWVENRIFKNFSKSLKTCFVGVFWVCQCIF